MSLAFDVIFVWPEAAVPCFLTIGLGVVMKSGWKD